LPWDGKVPATVVVVRKEFLEANPEVVAQFLKAHEQSVSFINENREETVEIIGTQIKIITGQEIAQDIIDQSLNRVFFTTEIDAVVLQEFADLTKELGFINGDSNIKDFIWKN
jgi:NitT/TauT family transport system substrate-binding protein